MEVVDCLKVQRGETGGSDRSVHVAGHQQMGRQLTVVREDGNGWNAEHRSEPREASAGANELARVGDDLRLNPEVHARRQYAAQCAHVRQAVEHVVLVLVNGETGIEHDHRSLLGDS